MGEPRGSMAALPQKDLMILLSGPIILLIRFLICSSGSFVSETAVCEVSALMRILSLHTPWEAFYALQPSNWFDSSVLTLLLGCLCLLAMLFFVFFYLSPKCPVFYIQPA